jgi:hypothetical protein
VESGEACYPGWELQRAGWTAAGRTFEARVGIAPGLADEDRAALIAAYESLAFEPAAEAPLSAVIATGTAAGEEWELVAERQAGGLALTLQGESGGSGGGGFEPSASSMTLLAYVIGGDAEPQRVVFGAVPSSAVRIEGRTDGQLGQAVPVADVPDEIDPDMNAFVFATPIGVNVTVTAYDAAGEVVATGEVGAGGGGSDPVETPLPSVVDVAPEHGGRYWAVYIWAGASPDDPQARAARDAAEQLGFNPGGGDLACDDGAAGQLGVPQAWSGVAIYFETRLDAETAYEWFLEADPEAAVAPVGVAEVRTYCLD